MIEKLEELKTKSELMLKYSNQIKKITNDVNAKANKRFILVIFIVLFFVVYTLLVGRYFVFSRSSDYSLVALLLSTMLFSLKVSAITTAVLYVPITFFLKFRRNRAFNKAKFEMERILTEIKELYISLNDYPASLLDYLNPFYLDKLIDYQKEGTSSIDEAFKKLKEEIRNNPRLQYSINAATKRADLFNKLFDLSVKEGVTNSYEVWTSHYSPK